MIPVDWRASMTISWILNSRISTLVFVLLATLQITSCSTEEVKEILANIEETSQLEDPANPTNDPVDPVDPVDPAATNAMYSYSSDLSSPRLLSGANLNSTTVYMFFTNTTDYSSMTFYCCKGLTGDSKGEAHEPAVNDSSAPFVHQVDLSQYTTAGIRELYVDAWRTGNSGRDSIAVNFTIATTTQTTSTPPVSEPPVSSPPPATPPTTGNLDVNLSWVAPFEREDNNPISPAEIAGYKIYYGTAQGNYTKSIDINNGATDNFTVENLASGTYYFVITTRDNEGRESQYSSIVTKTI